MRAKERLYLTGDRERIVNEHNPAGRFLYAKIGDEIPERFETISIGAYGVEYKAPEVKTEIIEEKKEVPVEPEIKMVEPVENKMAEQPENKSIGSGGVKIKRLKKEYNNG